MLFSRTVDVQSYDAPLLLALRDIEAVMAFGMPDGMK